MGFKHHNIILILGIVLLVFFAISLGWALSTERIHLSVLLAAGIIALGVSIHQLLSWINREILFFFRALENDDTSITYSSGHRSSFIDELHRHLNSVNRNFQELRLNNEAREQYFSRILEHLSSGLLIFGSTGHISQVNEEALRLLNMPKLTHLKALSGPYPGFDSKIRAMKSLDRSEVALRDKETGLKRTLGLQLVEVNLRGEDLKILTLQDLSAGMERKEIDDWIRLIRVMSHEIMNSLAPITSISTTLKEVWSEQGSSGTRQGISEAKVKQTLKGLDAIAEQSEGLTTFFESYRILSRIPDPVRKEFTVCSLFDKLETLVDHYRENPGLLLEFKCKDPDLKIRADEQMLVQVLLNLLKNAVEAVEGIEAAEIVISSYAKSDRIILQVADNGAGIAPELSGEIFIPFFTTRKKGTGVGLSYSRQVMAMHGGRIEFDSQPGRTRFRLVF